MACKACVPTEIHHTRGRSGVLLTDIRFFAAVCSKCHDWIHKNPAQAREKGLICEKGLWNKPAER